MLKFAIILVIFLYSLNSYSQVYSPKTIYEIPSMFIDPILKNLDKLEINSMEKINSDDFDYAPVISADGQTLYFVSNRKGSMEKIEITGYNSSGEIKELISSHDIWISERNKDGEFETVNNMNDIVKMKDESINTKENEGTISLSLDEKDIYYSSCLQYCKIRKRIIRDNKIYYLDLDKSINTKTWISQPSVSFDDTNLFFIKLNTDDPEKRSEVEYSDIYFSNLKSDKQKVFSMESINTERQEAAPYIASDGITLFFSSKGYKEAKAGLDYYVTRFDEESGLWTKPLNLKYLNTHKDDMFISIPARGGELFISSGVLSYNLYHAKLKNDPYGKFFHGKYCELKKKHVKSNALLFINEDVLIKEHNSITDHSDYKISIIDARGRLVEELKRIKRSDGKIMFGWKGKNKNKKAESGVYFYKLSDKEGNIIELGEIFLRRN